MENLTKENLETMLNDCLERADACPVDSDDFFKLNQKAIAIGQILNENQKIENDREVELKKIESMSNVTFKDWVVIGVPIVASFIELGFRSWRLERQTRQVCEFEKNYSFTTSAGRNIAQSFRDIFSFAKRGH